jgi:DNA-binding PadR family transcriptional regulator
MRGRGRGPLGEHIEARLRGFGWGGFGAWGGPGGHGPHGHRHAGGFGRRGRANVRAAVLALLTERPMHGYEMITELESRTGGIWRPSPGSVYPTLQLLEDEGLITSEESDGRRRFSLTEAGRAEAAQAGPAPWERPGDDDLVRNLHDIRDAGVGAMNALRQIMTTGTDDQRRRAIEVIDEARKKLYAILAE